MSKENSIFLSGKTIELSETSTYLTLRNRLCYYGEPNLNKVCLPAEGALEKAETLVGMPVVAKYKVDLNGNPDLGGHEMSINPITNEVKFNTENIGVHTAVEIKDDVVKVNGVTKTLPCLFADLKIWTRNKNMVAAVKRLFAEGKLTNSWELLSSSYKFEDGIKTLGDYCFEAVALLGSAVTPAYDGCAATLSVASVDENPELIIAEALAQDVASRAEEEEMLVPKENPEVEQAEAIDAPTPGTGVETPEEGIQAEATNPEGAEGTEGEPETPECASLTEQDLRDKIRAACCAKLDKWCWLSFHFPVEHVVWCEYDGRDSELDYVMFTYEVVDDVIVVGEPEYVTLAVNLKNINSELASKDDALAKANDAINTLKAEVASLSEYKEQIDKLNAEKEAAELSARKEALISYAVKSKFISEAEIKEDETIASLIEKVDESGIKGIIAERFMKSLDSAEQETASASEGKPEVVSASIEDDEEPASSESFIKAFLNKKTNF